MTAYAIAVLVPLDAGPEVHRYLEEIDATLAPFSGRFLVHGSAPEDVVEGEPDGASVVVAFPDRAAAEGWYASDAYRAILPLRTEHTVGWVAIVDGVREGHRATDIWDTLSASVVDTAS